MVGVEPTSVFLKLPFSNVNIYDFIIHKEYIHFYYLKDLVLLLYVLQNLERNPWWVCFKFVL